MTIELPHFDTRLNLYSNNLEKLEHTVAEYLFPKQRWAIGDVEKENCRPEHLRPFDGLSLQFSSRHRMFYGASQVAPLLYPNLSDRTAYGSLPFTSNRSFNELRAKILVIDDAQSVLMVGGIVLGQHYDVITAADGDDGIAKARAEQPDVILLDLVMPGLNGLETCAKLREDEATQGIPIILVSARANPETLALATRVGFVR